MGGGGSLSTGCKSHRLNKTLAGPRPTVPWSSVELDGASEAFLTRLFLFQVG